MRRRTGGKVDFSYLQCRWFCDVDFFRLKYSCHTVNRGGIWTALFCVRQCKRRRYSLVSSRLGGINTQSNPLTNKPIQSKSQKNYLNPIGLVLFYSKTRLSLPYDYIIKHEQNDTHGPISSPVSLLLPPLPSQRLLLLLSRLDALILLFSLTILYNQSIKPSSRGARSSRLY